MKYIRTKDGKIYEVVGERVNGIRLYSWQLENINKNKGNFYFDGKNICEKVADTIEELCDEYFAISNTNYKSHIRIDFENKIVCQCKNINSKYTFEQFMPYHTIYGAIWTDKGLIYVAKLNEKGNWELI